jgi:hypothetical protein
MSRKKKTSETWIPGASEISNQELQELTPVATRMALLKAVEAYERRDRAHLTDCYKKVLLAEGVAKAAVVAVTQEKDIDQLYEDLEATHDDDGISPDSRIRFQNIILIVAARANSRSRVHQIERRQQAIEQTKETRAEVRHTQALIQRRLPGATAYNLDRITAGILSIGHRAVERHKLPR